MDNWYDTKEGIEARLDKDTLGGLHELMGERVLAGYTRRERLREFFILYGRFYLDTCGNFMRSLYTDVRNSPLHLPRVIEKEELYKALGNSELIYLSWEMVGADDLPRPGQRCPVCDQDWRFDNCTDAVPVKRGDNYPRLMHRECHRAYQANDAREWWISIFKEVGFEKITHFQHPNMYCPCERCEPWARVVTEIGEIEIGWRKRVIHMDWKASGRKFPELFKDQDVTQWETGIHAWGRDKAIEYLHRLRDACLKEKSVD